MIESEYLSFESLVACRDNYQRQLQAAEQKAISIDPDCIYARGHISAISALIAAYPQGAPPVPDTFREGQNTHMDTHVGDGPWKTSEVLSVLKDVVATDGSASPVDPPALSL